MESDDSNAVLPIAKSTMLNGVPAYPIDRNGVCNEDELFHDTNSASKTSSSSVTSSISLDFLYNETKGIHLSSVFSSPGGTKLWKPIVDYEYTPKIGDRFKYWDDAVLMYTRYATKSGFSIRMGTQKKRQNPSKPGATITTHRYMLCSKHGKPRFQDFDSSLPNNANQRRSRFSVTECRSSVKFRYLGVSDEFELYFFDDIHNHCMVSSENVDLLKQNRRIGFEDQQFIHRVSLNRIGPNIAHNLQTSLKGGPRNVHGTVTDYKNASRDIRLFIGDRDATLVIETLQSRRNNLPGFFFEYTVVGNELRSLFWADYVSLRNYEAFGDVCAFDATYDTNRYRMIFVPFTGVDHHKRCVSFGAGLLYDETIESYTWLLQMFIKAHKRQPSLVLTDQDASMSQAVSRVFTNSIHRLCMWHIMKKLPAKISGDMFKNTNLRSSIHKLVWNVYISPEVFEEKWHALIAEYHLECHEWLTEMFNIRSRWVPCYFRQISMCCLMKTTSRCESENARVKVNSRDSNTLVQFLMCYDTSTDSQRNTQRRLDYESDTSAPQLKTNLRLESHAAEIYTWTVFLEVQKEIHRGMFHCLPVELQSAETGNTACYAVKHLNKHMEHVNTFEVSFNRNTSETNCTCLGFKRIGYQCRHVFCVYRLNGISIIPEQYVSRRWKRDVLPSSVYDTSGIYYSEINETSLLRLEISELVSQCVNRVRSKPGNLTILRDRIKDVRDGIFSEFPSEHQTNMKAANISDILNLPSHSDVSIIPPQGIRNKGSGTKRQRVGPGQKVVKRRKRAARLCKRCNKYVYDHDKRNCLKVKAAKRLAYDERCKIATRDNLPKPRYDVSDEEYENEPMGDSENSEEDCDSSEYVDTSDDSQTLTSSRRSSRFKTKDPNV